MEIRIGDHVQVRPSPDVDPHLWEHTGRVLTMDEQHHVIVELDTGEDCSLYPDQLALLPDPSKNVLNPFDIFPGPQRRLP